MLPAEHRAKVQALYDFMAPVWEAGGPCSVAKGIVEAALRGDYVEFVEYTAEMQSEQEDWKLGGSASRAWKWWQRVFPEELVLIARLKEGFRWDWFEEEWQLQEARDDNPDLDYRDRLPTRLDGDRASSFKEMILSGLEHGHIALDPQPGRPGWVILNFSIPKEEPGDFRWLMDLRAPNSLIHKPKFKMTGDVHLRASLDRDAWCATLDFKKYFWSFLVHPSEVWFQRFWGPDLTRESTDGSLVCDVLYHMLVAPMGNKMSPKMTCDYPNLIVKKMQQFGFKLMSYVDEVLVWETNCVVTYIAMMLLVVLSNRLGLALSYPKLVCKPTQKPAFLGWTLDCTLLRCSLNEPRRTALQALAIETLAIRKEGGKVPMKLKAQFQGILVAARPGLRQAGMILAWVNVEVKEDLFASGQECERLVTVRKGLARAAVFAADMNPGKNWAPFRNEVPSFSASADASEHAWAAHAVPLGCGGDKTHVATSDLAQDTSSEEELLLHHNVKEYLGVSRGLTSLVGKFGWRGTVRKPLCLSMETDSRTVLACFNNGRTRSLGCAARHLKFMKYLEAGGLQVTMTFLSGDEMVSARRTDEGSRFRTPWWKWALRDKIVQTICSKFRVKMASVIDLFAEESSARFPRYVTKFTHPPAALWNDALTQPWSAQRNRRLRREDVLWVFPPPRLLRQCWRMWEEDEFANDMVLIMPVKNQFLSLSRMARELETMPLILPSVAQAMRDVDGKWASLTSSPVAATPGGQLMAVLMSHRRGWPMDSRAPLWTVGKDGTLTPTKASTTTPTGGRSSGCARTATYIRKTLSAAQL